MSSNLTASATSANLLQILTPSPLGLAARTRSRPSMANLVSSAVDAMAQLEPARRRLVVATAPEGENPARVSVSDRGHGMTEAVGRSLYTPFFTTKADGLGLGLSICRSDKNTVGLAH